jgi:hypothetical protein
VLTFDEHLIAAVARPFGAGRVSGLPSRGYGLFSTQYSVAPDPGSAAREAHTRERIRSELMYIGLGLILLIVAVVIIVSMMRRGSRV